MKIQIGDRIVRLKDSHYHFDYGVKGMKKGEHIMEGKNVKEDPQPGSRRVGQMSGPAAQSKRASNGKKKALKKLGLAAGGVALAGLGMYALGKAHSRNMQNRIHNAYAKAGESVRKATERAENFNKQAQQFSNSLGGAASGAAKSFGKARRFTPQEKLEMFGHL